MTMTAEKFWDRVDKSAGPGGCWPWKLGVNNCGYGRASWGGKQHSAQRVAFMLANGAWPSNHGCHSCDNPPCCNPAHIYDGTHADNHADKARKGRGGKRLTVGQAKEILRLPIRHGQRRAVAADYGLSYHSLCQILRRERRRHVDATQ